MIEVRGFLKEGLRFSTIASVAAARTVAATLAAAGGVSGTRGVEPAAEPAQSAPDAVASVQSVLRPRGGLAWRDYFPNVELTTHNGDRVRFYDDLIKGKVVVINFMYATCTES